MATERWLFTEGTDGPLLGGGTYRCWLTVDWRANNSQAFLLSAEIDNSARLVPTHFRFTGQGLATIEVEVPAGESARIPATGDWTGLRVESGRPHSIAVW